MIGLMLSVKQIETLDSITLGLREVSSSFRHRERLHAFGKKIQLCIPLRPLAPAMQDIFDLLANQCGFQTSK